jgi:putative sigma-54 modulation protein
MDIIIQSLGFKAGEKLEAFTRQKLGKLKYDKIVRANVVLYKGPEAEVENNYCEIRLEVPGNDLFVKKHSPHFETSIAECVDVLAEKLDRLKTKGADRRQAAAIVIENAVNEHDADEDAELEEVVK